MDIFQFESYLKIDTEQFHEVNVKTLNHYLERYMLTVPFENIDVQNQKPISVDVDHLYNKIVHHKRGGFCYEMNTLFRHYLLEKGFDAHLVSATVHTPNGGWSRPGSHMSLIVYLDKPYVADVGFGDLPLHAMPLDYEDELDIVNDINGSYRAIYIDNDKFHVQKWLGDHWRTSYEGTLTSRSIAEFNEPLAFNQYNENSIFVKKLVISIPKTYGRVTMSENDLTITRQGEKSRTPVTKGNYQQFLNDYFDLHVKIACLENLKSN
ncbi:arylamine N-acetyltransferase family protein [Lentibacillus sp. Marseille-P4043]|uniref:arylamine N-acetyltransferase family protein n=1 Tax=Lentibacillus sp. Marseille-P4043 TaxID=2040293 RepID=UPI000D0ABAD6|nr:arylamine N-acetyltransferase [Lentibacillus sp. Marseille-P4043]